MNMSEKKRQEVYNAISETIMELRIELNGDDSPIKPMTIDNDLFRLESIIWKRVKRALNIDGI